MLRKTLRLSIIGINIMLICKCLSAGNWSYTDSMNITRHHHTTTLLQDGKVLVCAGGWNGLYQTASCQIYSPLTYTWSSTDSLHIHREKHTATLLPNGKVLVSGGWPITSSCEIYDPQTEEWAYTDSMNGQRVYHTATLFSNTAILVAGGYFYPGAISTCEIYDVTTHTWAMTDSLNTERFFHTAILLQDSAVFVTGGEARYNYTSSCEIYDSLTGIEETTVKEQIPHISILPNPFSTKTSIKYMQKKRTKVEILIYNSLGQKIKSLVSKTQNPGSYTIYWDGKDKEGRELASGVYFCKFEAGYFKDTKKLLILK